MAEVYGWSLEYIDSLSMDDIYDRSQIVDAYNKVGEHNAWLKK